MTRVFFLIFILEVINSKPTYSLENQNKAQKFDVVVAGATFSGIAAAINAARHGHTVALVEEYSQIGGLMTSGLSFTDFISYEVLGGTFRDYMHRVEQYYVQKYGAGSQQVKDCHEGIHAEPHVTLIIFQEMLEEYPEIQVFLQHRLEEVRLGGPMNGLSVISGLKLEDKSGAMKELEGEVFIDATYEGDLAAYAGADYRVGRESRQMYGETLAGKIFFHNGQILAGSTGEADHRVQGYNFRVIMTNNKENRKLIEKPHHYNSEEYLPIAEVLKQGKVSQVFVEKSRDGILRAQMLPNQKADINDIKNAPVRVALLGKNYAYPEGDSEVRQQIMQQHKEHILGMLYFLQNDLAVPEKFRKEAQEWGLAKDEFIDNNNFPYRFYVREARRIMGQYVFTEHDVRMAPESIRTKLHPQAIAIGDYALNCHGMQPPGPLYSSLTEGDFNHVPPPFQIPFGVITPVKFANLLVSVAVSASHVGFCGIRLEPTWTALGQAAGLAAHLAIEQNHPVGEIQIGQLQELLHSHGAKTCYVSDVDLNTPYFKAVQYFGTMGFFHHLVSLDTIDLQPAKSLYGTQYREAYPYHKVEPDKMLTLELAEKWIELLDVSDREAALSLFEQNSYSRGEFLNLLLEIIQK